MSLEKIVETFRYFETASEARRNRSARRSSGGRWSRRRSFVCCATRRNDRPYIISHIVDSRVSMAGSSEFRVRWSMYPPNADTWESAETLAHTDALKTWLESQH